MTTASDGTAVAWGGRNLPPIQLPTALWRPAMPLFPPNAAVFHRVLNSYVADQSLRRHGYEHPIHIGDSRRPV
jgi:hypothetical protein